MAERRMFAKTIIDSDAFLDMPISARLLYYDFAMRADDDGFVNSPKKIMRMVGASQDDINILCLKKFILPFDSGVIVIKHWRIHNYIRKDRYTPTTYTDEIDKLKLDENNAYTFSATNGQPTVNQRLTQVRIGEDSLGEDRKEVIECENAPSPSQDFEKVKDRWNTLSGVTHITGIGRGTKRENHLKSRIKENGIDTVLSVIDKISESDFLKGKNDRKWVITFDWFILPGNFQKVKEGNYDNRSDTPKPSYDLDAYAKKAFQNPLERLNK